MTAIAPSLSPTVTEVTGTGTVVGPALSPVGTMATSKFPPTLASITFPAPPPLPKVIVTKEDIRNNVESYENVLAAAATLRLALAAVADAENQFGTALEACSNCRGVGPSEDGLSGAAGLQYLAANHHKILSESFMKGFELPVRSELDTYAKLTKQHEEQFQKETIARTKQLQKTEKQNVKLGKKKQRNLALYRSALMDLTSQVDGLERLKYEYFKYSLDITEDISAKILKQATGIVRAEVEIFEGIARKGWTGEGLDTILESSSDPFAVDYDAEEEEKSKPEIHTILPHESILAVAEGAHEDEMTTAPNTPAVDSSKVYLDMHTSTTDSVETESANASPVVIENDEGEIEQAMSTAEGTEGEGTGAVEPSPNNESSESQVEKEDSIEGPPNVEGTPADWKHDE
ncbi:hypothetical protein V1512DRAFT_65735 [Lipomyces arxii]|uniref:uncharacterized protein n=1 Tax=Lipomyces arxii TaxID=56418 RepID=UPI0034CFF097